MPNLVATAGLSTSNSYISVSAADTYFTERLQATAWTGEDTDDKERALIMATRRIDQEEFKGTKTDTGQALKFPRTDTFDDDGEEYATNTIPVEVERATCELAIKYLIDDDDSSDPLADTGLEQFSRARVGPIDVTVRRDFLAVPLPQIVVQYLRPFIVTSSITGIMERA